MISAPRSSRASCVSALTEACVPTGRKNGVCTTPCGVVRRPRRAPVGSLFRTSKEKLTRPVYQEKMNAQPTRQRTKTAQTEKAMVNDFAPLSFLGFTAAKPTASRISVQKVKRSNDLRSATSHFAASSDKSAARLAATGFSKSAVPKGFKYKVKMMSGLLTRPVRKACEVMLKAVLKFVLIPPSKLYAPHITKPMISTARIGPHRPMT